MLLPRAQEFIELVRAGRHLAAIRHSQQHLAPWAEQHFGELQRAVASLVFGPGTACDSYKPLFAEERWDGLVALFRQELFRLHSMTQQSLLALQLQARARPRPWLPCIVSVLVLRLLLAALSWETDETKGTTIALLDRRGHLVTVQSRRHSSRRTGNG